MSIAWNPEVFPHHTIKHDRAEALVATEDSGETSEEVIQSHSKSVSRTVSIKIDPRMYEESPQYILMLNAEFESNVWLILSPHCAFKKR
jgi:hypothetical protein